jgi:hypothetical protein
MNHLLTIYAFRTLGAKAFGLNMNAAQQSKGQSYLISDDERVIELKSNPTLQM